MGIAARDGIRLVAQCQHLVHHEGEVLGPARVLRRAREPQAPVLSTTLATGLVPEPGSSARGAAGAGAGPGRVSGAGPGRARRGLLAAVALAILAGALALAGAGPPPWLAVWFTGEAPAAVAGRAVPPLPGDLRARIAVAGDTGTGAPAQHRTAGAMAEQARDRPYDALVLLGDLVYEDGDAELVDEVVLDPFSPVLERGTELVPVLGNHDYDSGEQQQILRALGRTRPWYVARVGPVDVVVVDSERVEDDEQSRWLRQTLADPARDGRWTVVAMHHPAFSAGFHGAHAGVRRRWVPLFEEHDVPLVLAGHEHDYQRSRVLDGVTYVISGAGAKLRPTGRRDFTAVSTSTLHFLDLLVSDDRLTGRAIDQSGRLVDEFTLARSDDVRSR